jgi:hypothetical protein
VLVVTSGNVLVITLSFGEGASKQSTPGVLVLDRRMWCARDRVDLRHRRLHMGILIRWVIRFLLLRILLRRVVPFIWRKYLERRGRG